MYYMYPMRSVFYEEKYYVSFYTLTELFLISPGFSVIPSPSKINWEKKKKKTQPFQVLTESG